MLSAIFGDSSGALTWTAESDLPGGSGEKCLLSSEITALTPDQFYELLEWSILNDKPATSGPGQYQTDCKVTRSDDGSFHVSRTYEASGMLSLLTTFKITTNDVVHIVKEKDDVILCNYGTDATCAKDSLGTTTNMGIHRDPFRISVRQHQHVVRRSGPFLAEQLATDLKTLGQDGVPCLADQDSPSQPGKKSVVSGPFEDTGLTPESWWQKLCDDMSGKSQGSLQADGTFHQLITEGMLFTSTNYNTLHPPDKDNVIVTDVFGPDESRTSLANKVSTKMHVGPPILFEKWADVPEAQVSTEALKAGFAEPFVNPILGRQSEWESSK